MKRRQRRVVVQNPIEPIPMPENVNLATGLVFLIGSFFNNTQLLEIEHIDRNSRFGFRYRGNNYRPNRRGD